MSQTLLTAIIILVVTYMFFSPRFPNAVVATIGAVAVALIGTVPFKSLFTYYASTSIVLMAGMMIIGGGMFHTGFAGWMGNSIVKLTGKSEKSIQVVAILSGAVMSSVCSGSAALMAPIGIAIAETMGIEPYGYVMATLFGSGICCLTPMATPILAFVMEGGHYTPKDIFKWGLLEGLASIIAVAVFVPMIWM